MALPILDGNQTAATLSTVLTSGEHIPAHTVVSLGSQAITDMRSAVSGSVVSISNFPATQPVSIASVTIGNTVTIAGTVKVDGAFLASGVTVFPSLFFWYDSQLDQYEEASSSTPLPIAGTVTVGNSVTIGSLPAISGTVTANAFGFDSPNSVYAPIPLNDGATAVNVAYHAAEAFPVSGTVTANTGDVSSLIGGGYANLVELFGNENIGIKEPSFTTQIAGTVTANNPSGALTTRFGSVTTASVAQLTSCVTNTSRKYLLAQNISAGTVTIGIGFSPTTTQGIQLTAGGGLTFDAFCPTGAVYWLGAVTGAAFTILEG
jgi:hypothetical protein